MIADAPHRASHDVQALDLLAAELAATAGSGSGEAVTWTQLVFARHLRLCLTGQLADLPAVDAAIAVAESDDDLATINTATATINDGAGDIHDDF